MSTKQHGIKLVNPAGNMIFNICTDTIQNNTGANRVVKRNQSMLVVYEDTVLFPIGDVHENETTIFCTGR